MSDETTTEMLAEIESQPEQIITPDDVAAEALAGVNDWPSVQILRRKLETTEAALLEQQQRNEQLVTQGSQQCMEIAELQKAVNGTGAVNDSLRLQLEAVKAALLEQQQQNERLVTQGSQQHMQIAELRSEVSYVQGLPGEERRRFAELETLTSDLRAVNAATEKAVNSAARDKADLQHRLDVVSSEWAVQAETIRGLQSQLEAVKAELVQVSKDRHALQVELDAREQVPEAVSDRFDQGFEQGTARAVETIAEWLEPLRKLIDAADNFAETNLASNLASDTIQALPHIMRSLTGLTDED